MRYILLLSHIIVFGICTYILSTTLPIENPVKFNPEKTIILIDASSFLYRSYYSIRPLHTPAGEAVHAVFGFCRMFKKLIDMFDPQYCALVWDSKGKTTRHETFPAYKATREAPPSDMFVQKERIIQFADLIGCLQVAKSGVEADDIMYSIAKEQAEKGYTVILVTSDKDMGQTISDHILIYDPNKDTLYDREKFQERMGVPIERLPFYFALVGDTSDNIPGVHGIGKKGAEELVNQFNSLEDLYAHLDQVKKPRTRAMLQEHQSDAFLSRDLFLLQYSPSGITLQNLSFNKKQWSQAYPFFQELHFRSLIPQVPNAETISIEKKQEYWRTAYNFIVVNTTETLDQLCAEMEHYKAFALDTETNGVRPLQATFVGISFCMREGTAYYIPVGHQTFEKQLLKKELLQRLKPYLEDPTYKKYLHNAKFDQKVLHAQGIELAGIEHDTILAASLVAKDGQRVGLKYLSLKYFNEEMLTYDDAVKNGVYKNFSFVPVAEAVLYAAADAHQTFKLVQVVEQELKKEHMEALYKDIELPVSQVLYAMECEGIICDALVLEDLDMVVTEAINRIDTDMQQYTTTTTPVNLNSPKQVQDLLFNQLQLPPQKKSGKGAYSTDQSVLSELMHLHPAPALIMEYRELAKLKSTYIDALLGYINPKTGRIHTSYNQVAVATGRLSSVEPNLQNIPLESTISIRSAFKPKEGHVFISADYSQIELRVLAHLSQDKTLIQAFKENRDIHQETAAHIFGIPSNQVTSEQRQIGKKINFSVLYGMTPFGLSKDMHLSFADAKAYIDRYFEQYPGVSKWMEKTIAFAQKHGYVETEWGRRRYVPAIYEKNKVLYQEAERIAINTVAQGTAAEIMKLGMIRLHALLNERSKDEHILLQIHDELLLSVPKSTAAEVDAIIHETLEQVVDWFVPLVVTTRQGSNWQEVTK